MVSEEAHKKAHLVCIIELCSLYTTKIAAFSLIYCKIVFCQSNSHPRNPINLQYVSFSHLSNHPALLNKLSVFKALKNSKNFYFEIIGIVESLFSLLKFKYPNVFLSISINPHFQYFSVLFLDFS